MAENTSLEWRFTPNEGSSTDRPTSGEIKFLNPTLSGNSGEAAFDYVNTIELQYPTQLSGIPLARHEAIEITITNHNIAPQVNTEPRSSSTKPEYMEYYRIDFYKAGTTLIEYDIFNSNQLRTSGWKQKWDIFQNDIPSYIGIELLRFRDDNALLNNNYEVISNFIIEFTVKEPVIGTDVLVSTPASTIQSDLDSNIAVLAANQALIDSAIAVGAGGIHGGLNLDSVQNIGLGPSLIKDSDGKFISPKVSGINVDSAQIDNLTFDSSSGNTLVISDSANISNLNTDSAHIKTLSGNSLNFDSGTFDKIKLGATSGITLGDSNESDGTGALDNYTKLLGTRITTPSLVSNKMEVDSANIGSELRVGRYRIEAGDSDDESVLLTDDYGGIHYYRNKGKYASLKFNERDDKWHFHPNIRVTDLDSNGLDETDDGINNTIRQLGAGGHGEMLSFNSILNVYEWDYIVKSGNFVHSADELSDALSVIPEPLANTSKQEEKRDLLHSTWHNINHGNIPNVTQTPLKYPYDQSMLGYVYYDTGSHTIKTLTTDHVLNSITGFVSDKSYSEYEATVKFTGDNSNKSMGFIIGYINEGEVSAENGIDVFAKQSTLTVFRTPNPAGYDGSDVSISNNTNFYTSYALVYNAFQPDQLILDNDGTSELGGTTHSTWSAAGVTSITIKKDLNYLRLTLSDFGDSTPDIDKILEFNLDENFDGLLRKFSRQVSYGVATNGVKGGRFDIQFDKGALLKINTDDQIIDLKNEKVYIYVDSDASTANNWPLGYRLLDSDDEGNPIDYFKEEFSLGRIYHNPNSVPPKTWYKDPHITFQLASVFNDVVDDKTPQLGGNLDLNGFDINNVSGPIIIDPSPVNDSAGLVKIKGNLEVDGTTTTINSTELTIVDKNIEIAKGASDSAAADGGGITIDGANAAILYNADSDVFALNKRFANPNASAVNLISAYNTNQLSEGANLYFTTTRARESISVNDAGGDGSLSYNSTTGIITYTGPSAAELTAHFSAANTGAGNYTQLAYNAGIYTLNVDSLTSSEIPSLDAAKINSGSFNSDRIPNLDASKITTGDLDNARISEASITQHEGALAIGGSHLTGTIANARVTQASITQHEAALAIGGSQLTGTIANARITQASITQHEAAIAIAGTQLTGTIPVVRMADSAVLLDNTGKIPTTSISEASITQHQANISIGGSQLTGTIADARVPESVITQHNAAITIPFSSVSSLPTTIAGYGITDAASAYTLPTATASVLGGIKVGSGLSISSGVLSSSGGTTINTNADNRVITGSGTGNELNGEANMTFTAGNLAVTGTIQATGDITAASSSDMRLKENLEKIDNALEKIDKINGYTFNWNDKSDKNSEVREVGVVAQEIEKILPEVVVDRIDGYKAVYYEKLVPLLIQSIKELKLRVEELENKC